MLGRHIIINIEVGCICCIVHLLQLASGGKRFDNVRVRANFQNVVGCPIRIFYVGWFDGELEK